ncbi:MAG TPA: hypothetical protein VNW89_08435, partial [Stellaceae bacterium]|nr:hypothetical protein [Stellaceae bacterium]
LVPISLAGWGVREFGFVVILAGFGIPADAALAASVLCGLCLIAVGLPGGLLWLTGSDIAPAIPAQSGRVASAVVKSTARAMSRTTSWINPREADNGEAQAEMTRPPPRPLEHVVDLHDC